jgi:hypothetical protein
MSEYLNATELEIILNAPEGMGWSRNGEPLIVFERGGGYRIMGPSTSKAAALSVDVPAREAQVLSALEQMPNREGTNEEISDCMSRINGHQEIPSNISPRIAPLRRKGYVRDTGKTRRSRQGKAQKVWGLV